MEDIKRKKAYPFLNGAGEMAELTRNYDWSTTKLGIPDNWPQSLRTTVSNLLRSKFPMFLWWGEEMVQFYNDAYRPSLGNEGKHPFALGAKGKDTWPEIWEAISPLLQHVQTTGEATWLENHLVPIYRNGKLEDVYWTFSYSSVLDDNGEHGGIMVTCMETTEAVLARHKIEKSPNELLALFEKSPLAKTNIGKEDEELNLDLANSLLDNTAQITAHTEFAESEAKYRTLFKSMDQGFCILEMIFEDTGKPVDYRFIETNPVFEQQTGLKGVEGKTALDFIPTLEQHWFEVYGKIAVTGEAMRFTQGSVAMGRMFDVYAFRIEEATRRRVAVLFTDITERKKAEEFVRHSEENLRNIILQAPVAMCIFNGTQYEVEIANERMIEFWGKASEDVLGKPIFKALPEAKGQGFEELLYSVYTTGNTVRLFEVPVTLPRQGKIEKVYVNFVYEAYKETAGTVSRIMAVAVDVTEQVLARRKIEEVVEQRTKELAQANDNLKTTNKELQRSNQNLEEFAHAASHDLQEPVRKIQFFTGKLKDQLSDHATEADMRIFTRIENATERMRSLIDDLLLYSHVSQRPVATEGVILNDKVQRVLEDLEVDIEEKYATIIVGKLPVIDGYSRQLQQMMQNLLSNALKYSKPDETPHIEISASSENENDQAYHVIAIKDNGIGFHQQYADQIFQMFTRLHGKTEYGGTGVGLSIVKKVVENHNGFIRVESEEGKGSLFKIYIPV